MENAAARFSTTGDRMFQWQPNKWLQFAVVGAALPWVGASWLSTDSLVSDVSSRAAAAAGSWAKVQFDGRDATVSGTAENQDAANAALAAVQSTYGVRLVNTGDLKVAPPPAPKPAAAAQPLAAPTIEMTKIEPGQPVELAGTWPEGQAKVLDVEVNKKIYELGQSPELTSSSGHWNLKLPAAALAAGSYEVNAMVSDGKQTVAAADVPTKLVVPEPSPQPKPAAPPTIAAPVIETGKPVVLSGTWAAGVAQSLNVAVNNQPYILGKDYSLLTDSSGNWNLSLKPDLPSGKYDVVVSQTDATGAMTTAATSFEIAAPPPPPAPPKAAPPPTIAAPKVEAGKPVALTGTWAAGVAQSMNVAVNGQAYQLGKDFSLLTDSAGQWTLNLKPDLPPGKYDVVISQTDGTGATTTAATNFEIAAPPPPPKPAPLVAPTVEASKSDSDHPTVKGTWNFVPGSMLQVELDGVTHTLGKNYDLLSDTAGHWTLKPEKPVVNGTYDVVTKVTAPDGRTVTDATKSELTVNVAAPPPAPPAAQPYDCEGTLARISAVFPIRFNFNHDSLAGAYPTVLNQYAALLKDQRCEGLKMQVGGHADYLGSESYNQGLSERRAQTVVDALVKAGVDKARLSGVGFSKNKPLDPAHSDDARAKNRRVEFTVQK
jgi:outer membrane protein OmpA-like peptidoglycan-associated protein